jgi:hypothetical protein
VNKEALIAIVTVATLFVCLGLYEVMVWSECLRDHSFLYCLRVLG